MKAFSYPTTSLFTPEGREIVAFSVEEYAAKIAEGCTDTPPEPPPALPVEVAPKPETAKERKAREKAERERGEAVILDPPTPEVA